MPFGLCNAPETFQRFIERILGDRIGVDVLVYLVDVLLFAWEAAALVKMIRQVLQLLIRAVLNLKATKCILLTKRVHYLGHIVTADSILPEPIKIDKI